METHKKLKLEQNALRWFIFAVGIALCGYCGLLCIGVKHIFAELLVVTVSFSLLAMNIWVFRLCWLAWAFFIYIYGVRICMVLADIWFFGEYLDLAHYIAFGVGVILILLLCFKIKSCTNHDELES